MKIKLINYVKHLDIFLVYSKWLVCAIIVGIRSVTPPHSVTTYSPE